MSTFEWPAALVPRNIAIRPPRKTVGLSTSLSQFTQAVPAIRPPFGLTMEFDTLFGSDVLAYRALLASLEGRANTVRVPLFDLWVASCDAAIGAGLVGHSDGSGFADGAFYLTGDLEGVLVTADQGARSITADFGSYGQVLQAGQYFGLGDQPYVAGAVTWSGSVATIRSSRTMVRAYAGERLRLRPVMVGRLRDDDNGELMLRDLSHGAPTIDFEEAFDEPLS
jgi:hypothetical protein